MDRAFDQTRKLRKQRVGLAAAAEEGDVDAAHKVLVDEHRDVAAFFQHAHKPHRCIEAGRNEVPMVPGRAVRTA